jgi:hypothetical protein
MSGSRDATVNASTPRAAMKAAETVTVRKNFDRADRADSLARAHTSNQHVAGHDRSPPAATRSVENTPKARLSSALARAADA